VNRHRRQPDATKAITGAAESTRSVTLSVRLEAAWELQTWPVR
jgi:hypothetical protein